MSRPSILDGEGGSVEDYQHAQLKHEIPLMAHQQKHAEKEAGKQDR